MADGLDAGDGKFDAIVEAIAVAVGVEAIQSIKAFHAIDQCIAIGIDVREYDAGDHAWARSAMTGSEPTIQPLICEIMLRICKCMIPLSLK